MQVYEEKGEVQLPIFHGRILKDYPGGIAVNPDQLGEGHDVIKKGTLLEVDYSARTAEIVKTAELQAGYDDSDDDHMKVLKNHEFQVGEYVGDGTNNAEITSIDKSNSDYDKLEFGGTTEFGTDLSEGDIVEKYSDTDSALANTPNAVCGTEVLIKDKSASNAMVSAVINAKVHESNLPYPLTTSSSGGSDSDHKGDLEPDITFI
ncbi:MAG: hypothetical protein ACOC4Y_00380 [bacterium]